MSEGQNKVAVVQPTKRAVNFALCWGLQPIAERVQVVSASVEANPLRESAR